MADRRRRRRRASQDSDDDEDESASGSESRDSGSQTSKSRVAREPEPAEVASERPEAKEEVQSECVSAVSFMLTLVRPPGGLPATNVMAKEKASFKFRACCPGNRCGPSLRDDVKHVT